VTSAEQFSNEIRNRKPGQDVSLKIERDGKPLEVKVKLGEYTQEDARREMELRFPSIFPPEQPGPQRRLLPPGRPGEMPRRFDWSFEQRQFIGVYCDELTPELAKHFGVKEGTALIVSKLTQGGPAEKAGLKVGDVIVQVDGKRVSSRDDLIDVIQDAKKGDKVKVEILRDKKAMTLEIGVEEEDVGGGRFGAADMQDYLQTWQDYTDAFRTEIRKWQNNYGPELRTKMNDLMGELSKNSKDAIKDLKFRFTSTLKRI
jgi:hypothetical protein